MTSNDRDLSPRRTLDRYQGALLGLAAGDALGTTLEFEPRAGCLRWWREGHWSSTGECFDIGTTIAAALRRFEASRQPMTGSTDPRSAGNGSLMRGRPGATAEGSRRHSTAAESLCNRREIS
jgi:ADP-ribosylglycohydrolase